MKPSQQCKQAGLKSLAELSRITGVSEQTLINWQRVRPRAFEVLVCGARTRQRIAKARESDKALDKILISFWDIKQ